ncbi:SDR family oxidoreductase [Salana multivorans]
MTPRPGPARVALVTGASRGIGQDLARGLAAQGIAVGLLARSERSLGAVVEEIEASGGRAAAAPADVTDLAAVTLAVGRLSAALGPIDLLVNNAGMIDAEVMLWEASPEQWRSVVETNLLGSFHVSRVVLGTMVSRGGGRVVDIVSGAGARDWEVATAYSASKAALIRTVGSVHAAGFRLGLRSFAVAPGTVETAMSRSMWLHASRTAFTPVERTIDLVSAIARGELDDWSGRYLRVTHDTPESLRAHGAPGARDRTFGVIPWSPDDPNLGETLVPDER